jgi:hypothetical protein
MNLSRLSWRTSENLSYEYFIEGTSANRPSTKFVCEPSRRAAGLPNLPEALLIFEPVFVLLAVGHGGSFEGVGLLL